MVSLSHQQPTTNRCTLALPGRPPWRPQRPFLADGGRAVGVWPEPTAQAREISAWKMIHFSVKEARSLFSDFFLGGGVGR